MKIDAVCVVEVQDDEIVALTCFEPEGAGIGAAQDLFKERAKSQGATEEEAQDFTEEGYYEQGTYQLFLHHSIA